MKKQLVKYGDLVFFNKNNRMKKKNFKNLFKVKKKTYFYNLYSRLYDFLIGGDTNLYKEFKKYYNKEYKSFEEFLIERYNMDEELLKKFKNRKSYYKKFDTMCDQVVHSLAQDEEIEEIINKFMGGYVYDY